MMIPCLRVIWQEDWMARALSGDLRSRVLAASAGGMSARSAAARFGIGISTAIAWIASARDGQLGPAKQGRPGGSRLDAHEAFIVGMIEASKDITLDEMVVRLSTECGVQIGRSALDVWLRRRGWTFKKRPHTHWSRSAQIS
jgi:transposase